MSNEKTCTIGKKGIYVPCFTTKLLLVLNLLQNIYTLIYVGFKLYDYTNTLFKLQNSL